MHRRSWGSLRAALSRGQIDEDAVRKLVVHHPLLEERTTTPVYAADVGVWSRCDAEASPERGYYYHPSRHSAGQPIVAGWAYQWIAQLGFARDSWVAPMDVRRVHPLESPNQIAVRQVKRLLGLLPKRVVRGTLVLVEVTHLPRPTREPRMLWLWWSGPGEPHPDLLWRAYVRRFDLEHVFRFLKQTSGWTTPRVRHPEQADLWTWLVLVAFTQLRLARPCVADRRLPWERRATSPVA